MATGDKDAPSEQGAQPPAPKPRRTLARKMGRSLGGLVLRAKRTDIWVKTKQAYEEGLEGKS